MVMGIELPTDGGDGDLYAAAIRQRTNYMVTLQLQSIR